MINVPYTIDEESLQRKAIPAILYWLEQLSGDVSIEKLFDKSFMKEYTSSPDIKTFLAPAGIIDQDSFDNWIQDARNIYVRDRTEFSTWDEFEETAAKKWAGRKQKKIRAGTWKEETFNSRDPFKNIKFHFNFHV